jgi:UDP-glucose 4-epimerase
MKKVVVFGGSGFLGSYVADELSRRGYEVLIADILEPKVLIENQRFVACDIMKPEAVIEVVRDTAVVYNFAGQADLEEANREPAKTVRQNIVGNVNVLEACRESNVQRFVYASSAYAFSKKGAFYGISKFASEKLVEEYATQFNLPFTIIRYGSLYGRYAGPNNGIYRILRQALKTGKIEHWGSGNEVREYIHAADSATLSVDIIENKKFVNQHIILTGVERLKQRDLLRMVQEIMDDNIAITYTNATDKTDGHYETTPYSFHPNMAKKLVPNPFIDLGQGLVECIEFINNELHENEDA